MLQSGGLPVQFNMVIRKQTLSQVPEMLCLAVETGADAARIWRQKWSFTMRIDMSEDSLFTIYGFGANIGEGLSLAKRVLER
jgi:hypothetical protein